MYAMRRALLMFSCAVFLGLTAASQTAAPQQTPAASPAQQTSPAVIRTTTRLVQIHVTVRDEKNHPLTGLKKENFTILDGGKPQQIAVFSSEAPAAAPTLVHKLPPNIFTNRHDALGELPGTNTILFLDGINTQPTDQAHARDQALKFLRTIRPQDHFAVYALTNSHYVQVLHDFTADDSALIKAINDFTVKPSDKSLVPFSDALDFAGLAPSILRAGPIDPLNPRDATQRDELRDERTRYRLYPVISAIISIANHVATIPGRKNLIWISGGTPLTLYNAPDRIKLSELGYTVGEPKYAETGAQFIRAAAESCNAANVVMYTVDVHGVTMLNTGAGPEQRSMGGSLQDQQKSALGRMAHQQDVRDTFRTFADDTGGIAFYGNNDIAGSLQDAFDDSRYSYTIGFYPENTTWDGKFHKIEVKVDRKTSHIRHRDGYFATPDDSQPQDDPQKLLQNAANSPLDSSALSLMVSVQHVESVEDRQLKFQVGVDVAQLLLQHSGGHWKGGLDLGWVQRNDIGEVVAAQKQHVDLDFSDPEYKNLQTQGAIFQRTLPINPDSHDVRVVALDPATLQVGTVTIPMKQFIAVTTTAPQLNHP
jgi:VWFA-related protein